MATANLNKEGWGAEYGNEGIIIIRDLADIPGGRTLDVTDWPLDHIPAGTIIGINRIKKEYLPWPVSKQSDGTYKYDEVETGAMVPVGILKATITKAEPFAAIMTMGEVNVPAVPFGSEALMNNLVNELAAPFVKGIIFSGLDTLMGGEPQS